MKQPKFSDLNESSEVTISTLIIFTVISIIGFIAWVTIK